MSYRVKKMNNKQKLVDFVKKYQLKQEVPKKHQLEQGLTQDNLLKKVKHYNDVIIGKEKRYVKTKRYEAKQDVKDNKQDEADARKAKRKLDGFMTETVQTSQDEDLKKQLTTLYHKNPTGFLSALEDNSTRKYAIIVDKIERRKQKDDDDKLREQHMKEIQDRLAEVKGIQEDLADEDMIDPKESKHYLQVDHDTEKGESLFMDLYRKGNTPSEIYDIIIDDQKTPDDDYWNVLGWVTSFKMPVNINIRLSRLRGELCENRSKFTKDELHSWRKIVFDWNKKHAPEEGSPAPASTPVPQGGAQSKSALLKYLLSKLQKGDRSKKLHNQIFDLMDDLLINKQITKTQHEKLSKLLKF